MPTNKKPNFGLETLNATMEKYKSIIEILLGLVMIFLVYNQITIAQVQNQLMGNQTSILRQQTDILTSQQTYISYEKNPFVYVNGDCHGGFQRVRNEDQFQITPRGVLPIKYAIRTFTRNSSVLIMRDESDITAPSDKDETHWAYLEKIERIGIRLAPGDMENNRTVGGYGIVIYYLNDISNNKSVSVLERTCDYRITKLREDAAYGTDMLYELINDSGWKQYAITVDQIK